MSLDERAFFTDRVATSNPAWTSAHPDPGTSQAPYRLYNIGNNNPVELMHLIGCLERSLGRPAVKNMLPMQPGDVAKTYASTQLLEQDFGYKPIVSIREGIAHFVDWYQHFYECRR